jgi:hypothetical protein
VHAHAGGGRLLAGIQVNEAGDLAGGELDVQALFEFADGAHQPVGVQQVSVLSWVETVMCVS